MECKRCGNALSSNSYICSKCGMMMSKEQILEQKNFLKENKNFTPKLIGEQYGQKMVFEPQKNDSKFLGLIFILLILIIIIGIAIGVYLLI